MHRHLHALRCWAICATALMAAGCVAPSSRDNVAATAQLVASQTTASVEWRRDSQADRAARAKVEGMLANGLTLNDSVAVAFLVSPELQLALEQLEISRAELVAAVTPPNPVAIIGVRDPGGNLAAFYPDRSISIGVLENVIALLNIPDRRAVATRELERTRLEVAGRITRHAAQVTQAWLEYNAALQIVELRGRVVAAARAALDTLVVQAANGGISTLDVAVERNTVFSAESSAQRAQLDAASARERLGQSLGLTGWRDDWRIEAKLPPLPAADPDVAALERTALERRFDVRAADKSVAARLRVLATQRRFRWLNQLEVGAFRDKAIGGTTFTGPNIVTEVPLFDQRQAQLLNDDSQLRSAMRTLEATRLAALAELRVHAAEMHAIRALVEQYEQRILPNQHQIAAALGTAADPGQPDRLRLRLSTLAAEEEHVGLLRDYWRARSALALAVGDWGTTKGL